MKYEITKGSEKDFEGAPEWATMKCHCTIGDPKEIKNENLAFSDGIVRESRWVDAFFVDGGGGTIHREEQWHVIAERRPITEQAWDGEGLPPVGVECEMHNDRGTWLPVDVIAHKDGFAFGWSYDYRIVLHSDKTEGFRPIRSPEDVARDEAIDAMRDVGYTLPAAIRFTKEEMASLYDAGYRKME